MSFDFKIKILLVEDSRFMRSMELNMLKEAGFDNVITAGDGEEAIDILQKQEDIDLIISDWNMPKKMDMIFWYGCVRIMSMMKSRL